ncbi:MAG: monofunctional biosynthetic peptidoglycan transglycosylase [Desulfobacterales bacterium]|nr:monofunctional biosynthetic peptidoglycan transglycosylase [Desulfobacterales bacterium]
MIRYRKKNSRSRKKTTKLLVFMGRLILTAVILSVLMVLCFRWVSPPTSAFMLKRHFKNFLHNKPSAALKYRWIDLDKMSPYVPLAVIASEDQKFPHHWGFDIAAISDAVGNNLKGGRLRGASTITQQVAKNMFLWSGRSFVRKGLEAYFTVLLELLWSKNRILEVYLNIAEFGDGIYGVRAAAETFYLKPPSRLTRWESAILAAVLPSPRKLKVSDPSPYVIERAGWIEEQMAQLGGIGYLRNI